MAKKMNYKKQKAITTVLQVLVFFVTIVMVTALIPVVCFSSPDPYYKEIVGKNSELDTMVRISVKNALETPSSIVNIPEEELSGTVDYNAVAENAKGYTKDVLDHIFFGTPIPEREYDFSKLENKVDSYFAEHTEIPASDAEKAKIKQHYSSLVQGMTEYVSPTLTEKLSSAANLKKIVSISTFVLVAAAGVWLILAAVIVVLNKDNIVRGFYRVSTAGWTGSVTIAIPCIILAESNISGRLILTESSLSRFVCCFIDELESLIMITSIVHLVLFTVLLGCLVFAYASKQNKRHKKHSHSH